MGRLLIGTCGCCLGVSAGGYKDMPVGCTTPKANRLVGASKVRGQYLARGIDQSRELGKDETTELGIDQFRLRIRYRSI